MKKSAPKVSESIFSWRVLPFFASVFISAFLLFQVQPLIGKYILPWFGGGSSVWTTTILFFELLLLVGYGYAFFLTRLTIKRQVIVHTLLVLGAVFLLGFLSLSWVSPITPPMDILPPSSLSPVLQVLLVLLLSVGFPYFLLSTTSSLLQRWFGKSNPGVSPYPLYSLSNAGSLLGLVTYPFIIEVLLPLRVQGVIWAGLFIVFALFLGVASRVTLKYAREKSEVTAKKVSQAVVRSYRKIEQVKWLILPMISSMILLATTSQITQSVAPAPFLWILPLGLYLLSFILCFSDRKLYWRKFYMLLFLILSPLTVYISLDLQSFIMNLSVYAAFTFVSFMLLHGELYLSRPDPEHLNLFYFTEALGSVIGGVFVGILAPVIFNDFWEFYIAVYLTSIVAVSVLITDVHSPLVTLMERYPKLRFPEHRRWVGAFIAAIIFAGGFWWVYTNQFETIAKTRNFYGLVSVASEYDEYDEEYLTEYNGRINHGLQYVSEELRYEPVSYFGPESGIALALTLHPKRLEQIPLHIGVTGLGIGTIAAYGEPGDRITFYEINPNAISMAYEYFTYLDDSDADITVIPGDARLTLQDELVKKQPKFDILVLDAFVDDAIPMHLLTKEAFALYLKLLDHQEGILAVNISNRYLSLESVIAKMAEEYGMEYSIIYSDDEGDSLTSASWVLLSYNHDFMNEEELKQAETAPEDLDLDLTHAQVWTDDYSNLFQSLYLE